ncbi:MAG: S53 family peptidase [Candidatus Nanopelagicales bacterium]
MRVRPLVFLAGAALVAGSLVAPGAAALSPSADASAAVAAARDANTEITFFAGLPRDTAKLQEAAVKRSTPGELEYRDHPSITAAGKAYGAKSKTITKLRKAAEPLGITVSVDKDRILARLTATVATWEEVYGQQVSVTLASAAMPYDEYAFTDAKGLLGAPRSLASVVEEMVPFYAEYVAAADTPGVSPGQVIEMQQTLASAGSPLAWPRNLGTLPPGTCDAPALEERAVYAPGQIQTAYGTTALARKGVRGDGARLTIVSLGGGYDADDIAAAADCFGYDQPQINVERGTGVPQAFVNATLETHLDLITASSVLNRAESITLLEVVSPATGFTDAFARILDAKIVPDAVSMSYGLCEPLFADEFAPLLTLNEDLLRMAAIVGTTVVVATGDYGTSMCGADVAEELGEPTLWYPATSPWVTAVGGTRLVLRTDNTRRTERVWNDMPYAGGLVPAPSGAGGPSSSFPRPWWQAGSTPVGPRVVPDVAVLGALKPGWPIVYGDGLYSVGGTSGGAPFVAANLAAMSAKQRDRGYPTIGFANAWLYQAAAAKKQPYFDIDRGNNGVQLVGCCVATTGFDMASGLGAPSMDLLYSTLPRPAG